jgi:lysozyme family protein
MADFKIAVQKTLVHEGGFQKNPNDHANWSSGKIGEGQLIGTKYGITAVDMPGVDIENLTPNQAIAFYAERYWKTNYSQIESQAVADKLFDLGVLFGVHVAVGILQTVLGVTSDGVVGPVSLGAINQVEPVSLYNAYKAAMVTHAINVANANPHERENLGGWIRRINCADVSFCDKCKV